MHLPTKTLERRLFAEGYRRIIAVDEVGMGCLAGPVVVCAVMLTKKFPSVRGVRDSKLLSPKQRETCADLIKKLNIKYKISYCYPKTIDRVNIFQASHKAMRRAIAKLKIKSQKSKVIILIDGPNIIKKINLPQQAIVRGDRKVFAIACASILAKVYRDRIMARYHKKFPQYGFDKHKGYGTRLHFAMLAKYGPTIIHRRSFAHISRLV